MAVNSFNAQNPPVTTKGDVFTFSTIPTRLGVGANNTVLTADSSTATGLKWAAPAGGKLLQLVRATTSTATASTSSTFADTTLSGTITPTSATSKILVFVHQNGLRRTNAGYSNGVQLRLFRGSTQIYAQDAEGMINSASTLITLSGYSHAFSYLDEPATTSATTYKTQFASYTGDRVDVQYAGFTSDIVLMEIGA